jgi:hypothetical protein
LSVSSEIVLAVGPISVADAATHTRLKLTIPSLAAPFRPGRLGLQAKPMIFRLVELY